MPHEHADIADSSLASYRHDVSAGIDKPEDRLMEIIAAMAFKLPPGISGKWFAQAVAKVAVAAIKDAVADGAIEELLEEDAPAGQASMELAMRILAELIDSPNPRLDAKCLSFAFGLPLTMGVSETQIGREEGASKAVVSKRVRKFKEAFGVGPSRGMKSEAAVESYRVRQTGRRARPLPQPWAHKGFLSRFLHACPVAA